MNRLILSLFLFVAAGMFPVCADESSFDFSDGKLPEGWKGVRGAFVVKDGAVSGKEIASDNHAAVLTIPDPHANSTISLRFQMAGAKGFHLSYNHPKGHLFRVRLTGGSVSLILDKDKKDPASKAETLATAKFEPEPGEWYELKCEAKGNSVTATVGEISLKGEHEKLTREKTGFRFIVQGESVLIDDVAWSIGE